MLCAWGLGLIFAKIQPRPRTHNMIQSRKYRSIKGLTMQTGELYFSVFFPGGLCNGYTLGTSWGYTFLSGGGCPHFRFCFLDNLHLDMSMPVPFSLELLDHKKLGTFFETSHIHEKSHSRSYACYSLFTREASSFASCKYFVFIT